jgi:hypothetical protein
MVEARTPQERARLVTQFLLLLLGQATGLSAGQAAIADDLNRSSLKNELWPFNSPFRNPRKYYPTVSVRSRFNLARIYMTFLPPKHMVAVSRYIQMNIMLRKPLGLNQRDSNSSLNFLAGAAFEKREVRKLRYAQSDFR